MEAILKQKIEREFLSYFGHLPKIVTFNQDLCYADGYWCRILNGKTIKKTHGICWRRDTDN